MRAPPLASRAAVAAPRPDADPVTIAHKPSFDIRVSFCLHFELGDGSPYRGAGSLQIERNFVARNSSENALHAAMRASALVRGAAFPHHARNQNASAGSRSSNHLTR